MAKILVIDDERSIRNTLKEILEFEDHKVDVAENGIIGIEKINKAKPDLVLCDIKMPEQDGIETLKQIQNINQELPVIMISGHGNIDTAVEAIKLGAYDFIEKPLDLNRILVTIKNATEKSDLIVETKKLKKQINKKYQIIGESDKINDLRTIIDKIAPTDARVLILGQNGTGKELVARQIHECSDRKEFPFVEVNCAAIPSELIESELFGHEKGAFTSANKQRKGKFEQANGGTIFLDEVGDMSLAAQAKVLRVLQENKISRVGGDKDLNINVRVLAATNKNIQEEIQNNNFREDLYHRLSVIVINNPSLSERKEDIPLLVEYFNQQISNEHGTSPLAFDQEAHNELSEINWSGNIRELRNVVERLLILCDAKVTKEDVIAYAKPLFQ